MSKLTEPPRWIFGIFLHWPIFTLALWVSSSIFDGIEFQTVESIFISSLIFTVLNLFIKPIILLLALPLAVLSLGLVVPFLNGLFILIVSQIVNDFYIDSYFTGVIAAVFISLTSFLTQIAIGAGGKSILIKKRKSSFYQNTNNKTTIIDVEVKEKNK